MTKNLSSWLEDGFFALSDVPIFACENLEVAFVNSAFAKMVGQDEEMLTGANLASLLRLDESIAPASGSVSPVYWDVEVLTPTPRASRVDLVLITSASSTGLRILGIALNSEERTAISEARMTAQRLEALGRLAGGVAHDFGTIMGAINTNVHVLLDNPDVARDSDAWREIVEEIGSGAYRASSLTSQLLAFASRQPARPVALDVNTVIRDMGSLMARLVGEDMRVEPELDESVPLVRADPVQIEQVLLNLVVNSRDAMPDGGRVTIRTRHRRRLDLVEISVADVGVGMPPDVRLRAAEPFFTTKEPGRGTGLGLATVYGIVNQLNGRLEIESEVGEGTTIRILLPPASQQ